MLVKKIHLFLFAQSIVFLILFTQPKNIRKAENIGREAKNGLLINAISLRADINSGLKRYEEAISDYNRVIELDPYNYFAYLDRGSAYRNLKQYPNAIEDYSQAIKLDYRKSGLGYANRAYTYELKEKYQKALLDYNVAIKSNPTIISFRRQRGYLYSFELKQHAKAILDYNRILELDPKNTEVYIARGYAFHALDNYSEAILDYDRALEGDDFINYVALNNLGLIQYELNNIQQAIAYWRKALQIDPNLEESTLAIAVTMYQQGKRDKAIKLAEKAINLDSRYKDLEFLKEQLWGNALIEDTQDFFNEQELAK